MHDGQLKPIITFYLLSANYVPGARYTFYRHLPYEAHRTLRGKHMYYDSFGKEDTEVLKGR